MVAFIPYGRLSTGNYATLVDGSGNPGAAVIEILSTLPATTDTNNFTGRTVFINTNASLYQFTSSSTWTLVNEVPVLVGSGSPGTYSPAPATGQLYYDDLNIVVYTWTGSAWAAIGGQFAATVVTRSYLGNGTTTVFPTGATSVLTADNIWVTVDGVTQSGAIKGDGTQDFYPNGTTIVFTTAPANGTNIQLKSLQSGIISGNTQASRVSYTGDGSTTAYTGPDTTLSYANTFVFVNGSIKIPLTDYTITPFNTGIVSITNTSDVATVTTTSNPHYISVGASVTLNGVTNYSGWNASFTVLSVPTANTFTFSVSSSFPSTGTGPSMYFTPSFKNDTITFTTAPANASTIDIRSFKNVSTLSTGSGVTYSSVSMSTSGTLTLTSVFTSVYINVASASITITLPAAGVIGRRVTFLDPSGTIGTSSHTLTVNVTSSGTINGQTTKVLSTAYNSITVEDNGSVWTIVCSI